MFLLSVCYSQPLRCWKEARSAILSLLPHKQGLFISTGVQIVYFGCVCLLGEVRMKDA